MSGGNALGEVGVVEMCFDYFGEVFLLKIVYVVDDLLVSFLNGFGGRVLEVGCSSYCSNAASKFFI